MITQHNKKIPFRSCGILAKLIEKHICLMCADIVIYLIIATTRHVTPYIILRFRGVLLILDIFYKARQRQIETISKGVIDSTQKHVKNVWLDEAKER